MSSAAAPALARGLDELARRLTGRLVRPQDADWEDIRRPWQLVIDQRPVAVVLAADVDDVVAAVEAAGALGIAVAPQATGHAAGAVDVAGALLVRTDALREVTIDPTAGTATAAAGARWADVAGAAAEHDLAAVAGMSADVGVVGLLLGGGIGWLARSHGLAANRVRALEVIDARGRRRHVDAHSEPDLFWALRGGSAPVIVTAVTVQLVPVARVCAGSLLWPLERAHDVLHAWREWAAAAPDSVTSLGRVLRYPPLPDLPPMLRGRSFVSVEAAIQAPDDESERMLMPLRALSPEIDTFRSMSPAELADVHGDPPQPVPAHGDSILLADLESSTIDAFLAGVLDARAEPLLSAEIRQLGGALSRVPDDAGAVSTVDGAALVFVVGIAPNAPAHDAVARAADAVLAALAPHASPRAVRTFRDRPTDPRALYGDALDRLRRMRDTWDPDGIVRVAHDIR